MNNSHDGNGHNVADSLSPSFDKMSLSRKRSDHPCTSPQRPMRGTNLSNAFTESNSNYSSGTNQLSAYTYQTSNQLHELTPNAIVTMHGMASFMDKPSFTPTVQVLDVSNVIHRGGPRWEVCVF